MMGPAPAKNGLHVTPRSLPSVYDGLRPTGVAGRSQGIKFELKQIRGLMGGAFGQHKYVGRNRRSALCRLPDRGHGACAIGGFVVSSRCGSPELFPEAWRANLLRPARSEKHDGAMRFAHCALHFPARMLENYLALIAGL